MFTRKEENSNTHSHMVFYLYCLEHQSSERYKEMDLICYKETVRFRLSASLLTCDLQVSCRPLRSSDPVSDLTDVGPSVLRLDGVDDEVAGALDRDPALHAAH